MQCGECQTAFASIMCLECHESYCNECTNIVHQKGRRKLHTKFIRQVVCVECEEKAASLKCEECPDFFCQECSNKIHHKGMRQNHNVHALDGDELNVVSHDTINVFHVATKDITFSAATGQQQDGNGDEKLAALEKAALSEINDCLEIAGNKVLASAMCSIPPEDADVPTVISVSTEDSNVVRLKADSQHKIEATERMRQKFQVVMSSFHCWRRWRSISQNASVFCDHKNATAHQRPIALAIGASPPNSGEKKPTSPRTTTTTAAAAIATIYDVKPEDHVANIPFFARSVIDDHFFQLAIAAICTRRCMLLDNIVSCEYAERGLFAYKLYRPQIKVDGSSDYYAFPWEPELLNIDTMLPCSRDLEVAVGRTTHRDEFYLALLSKAYATHMRSYGHLHKGCTVEALMRLTGGEPTIAQWYKSDVIDESGNNNTQEGESEERKKKKRKEAFAGISANTIDELWWLITEATKWGCPMVAMDTSSAELLDDGIDEPLAEMAPEEVKTTTGAVEKEAEEETTETVDPGLKISQRTSGLNWCETAKPRVVFFGLPYDPKHQGPNSATAVRLVKTRTLFSSPGGLSSFPETRAWADTSKEWNKDTRADLQHYNVDGRVEWITVEELAKHMNCFAFIRNFALAKKRMFVCRIPFCPLAEQVLFLPHFLLEIEKKDDQVNGGSELNFNENFMRLDELEVPALIDGDETDDENDPLAASNASTPRSSVVDGPIASSAAQCNVFIRISQPKSYNQPFDATLMAFRVSKPERQAPVRSFEDGAMTYSLPVHSRVGVKKVAQLSETEQLYELPANTGCYNVVLVPVDQKLVSDVLFSASIEHHNDMYKMKCHVV